MPHSPPTAASTGSVTRIVLVPRLLTGLAIALLAGVATSFLQTVLPDGLASAANSAGTWCGIAFAITLWCAPSRGATLIGPSSLALLVAGYYATADARGFPVSTTNVTLWLIAAVVVGLIIGLASVWLVRDDVPAHSLRRAIASAPLPGILIGEGLHGVLRLAETTSVVYWSAQIVVGVALGGWLWARRVVSTRARLIAVTATAAVGAAVLATYGG